MLEKDIFSALKVFFNSPKMVVFLFHGKPHQKSKFQSY